MADLTQNSANVALLTGGQTQQGIFGEAMNAGTPTYYNSTASKWYKASAASNLASGNQGLSIALTTATGANQPGILWVTGPINVGATLAVGQSYILSINSGLIAPITDLAANSYVSFLGIATNAAYLVPPTSGPYASGVPKA